jgi:hypothetical protein
VTRRSFTPSPFRSTHSTLNMAPSVSSSFKEGQGKVMGISVMGTVMG